MKKIVKLSINESELLAVSEVDSIDDAFEQELGWVAGSGIDVDSIYDENMVIIPKVKPHKSELSPLKYSDLCDRFVGIARNVIKQEGVFKWYDDAATTIYSQISKALPESGKMTEAAKAYALDAARDIIKRERDKYTIQVDEEDCIKKAINRTSVMAKEAILDGKAVSHGDKVELVSNLIYEQVDDKHISYDQSEGAYVYKDYMQNIVNKVYNDVMAMFDYGSFDEYQQSILSEKLVKRRKMTIGKEMKVIVKKDGKVIYEFSDVDQPYYSSDLVDDLISDLSLENLDTDKLRFTIESYSTPVSIPEGLTCDEYDDVADLLSDLDEFQTDEKSNIRPFLEYLIEEFYELYPNYRILPMSKFNEVFKNKPPLEVAEIVSRGKFDVKDSFFQRDDNGYIFSIQSQAKESLEDYYITSMLLKKIIEIKN